MRQRLNCMIVLCICIFSTFGSLAFFSAPAFAHSAVVAKNVTPFRSQCTYNFNIGTSYEKAMRGSCDALRYIIPNTACGNSASQFTTFSANGDTLHTAIYYEREPNPNCGEVFIGTAEEGIFGGSHAVTWYYFTYADQGISATCYYLNGDYGHLLYIYPNIAGAAGQDPLFTNYNGVGCNGSAYGHYTPALN